MSNIEPTEEQKQAARELTGHHMVGKLTRQRIVNADDIAQLLAEREAKLREAVKKAEDDAYRMSSINRTEMLALRESHAEADTLRARVAELEASDAHLRKLLAEERGNVGAQSAQHLADIKALMACCHAFVHDVDRLMCGIDVGRHAMVMRATVKRLAHYDDAKAAEYFDKAREVAREVAAWPDWKKAGFRPGDTEGGEG